MKRAVAIASAAALGSALFAAVALTAHADAPPPRLGDPPPAAPPPAPSVSAAAPAPSPPSSTATAFESETFGDESSKQPTPEEWKAAKELLPTRRGARADKCHVWRVREWIRVSCPDLVTAAVAMLGGTPTGMSFWIDPPREGGDAKLPAGGEVLFPVRKGDRRVVQFLSFGPGYEGPFTQLPALVVQELWPEGTDRPVLLLY